MNNSVLLITLLLMLIFGMSLSAQQFGIKAGMNSANLFIKYTDNSDIHYYIFNPGFHLGSTIDFHIKNTISLESGILFITKGDIRRKSVLDERYENLIKLYYLEIPAKFKIIHQKNEKFKVFFALGPYLGIGLSGKQKIKHFFQGKETSETDKISWGNRTSNTLKRLDIGTEMAAGTEIKAIIIELAYQYGFRNLSTAPDVLKIHNSVAKVSLGYRF